VFRKSDVVYGLDLARQPIARVGAAVIVEGYTDVLALHQVGVGNAVASMGTALTAQQVSELKRVCSTLLLAFDADAAGQEASVRGIELALAQGFTVKVVSLPAGRDPADVALEDADSFRTAMDAAVGYLTFRVDRLLAQKASRDEIYARVRTVLRAAPASVERDDAVRTVTDRLGLQPDLARDLVAADGPARAAQNGAPQRIRRTPWEHDARLFLGLCLAMPEAGAVALADLDMAHFDGASLGDAARYVRRQAEGESSPEEAHKWAPLIAELDALAAREQPSLRALEELSWKLRLHALESELKKLGQNAEMPLSQQTQLQELQKLRLSYLERLETVRAQAPDQ
jgi:DNA primase